MKNRTILYIDMDGTIADLYGEPHWLEDLNASSTRPFENAKPMISQADLLKHYPIDQYDIRVLSMTPKNATPEYCKRVAQVKDEWLNKYFPIIKHRVYIKYGHNKNLRGCRKHTLIDDNETIRLNFKGQAYAPMWAWAIPLKSQVKILP